MKEDERKWGTEKMERGGEVRGKRFEKLAFRVRKMQPLATECP